MMRAALLVAAVLAAVLLLLPRTDATAVVPRDELLGAVSRVRTVAREDAGPGPLAVVTRDEAIEGNPGSVNVSERKHTCAMHEPTQEQREDVYRVMAERRANPLLREYDGPNGRQVFAAKIKVKYHVFHRSNGDGRIPESVIERQHEVLQERWNDARTNDPVSGAPEVFTFEMLPINYVQSNSLFTTCGNNQGLAVRRTYTENIATTMNVYICDIGALGFVSDFPDANASQCNGEADNGSGCDGVFIDYTTVPGGSPPFDEGITLVHEVGHYLGVFHTFNYGSCNGNGACGRADCDGIDDTPRQASSTSGCPIGRDSCPNRPTPNGDDADPVRNYMDYSHDSCMFQTDAGTYQRTSGFTENQMELMMEQTARFRPAMIVPPGPPPPPSPPSPPPPDCSACTASAEVTLRFDDYCAETSWRLEVASSSANRCEPQDGAGPGDCTDGALSTRTVSGLCAGEEYTFTILDSFGDGMCCGYGQGSYELTVEGETIKTGGEFGGSEATDFTVPGSVGAWVLSGTGKKSSCAKVCQNLGKTCNASKMDELDTPAKTKAALAELGVTCQVMKKNGKGFAKKVGVPGYRVNKKGKNVCVPARSSLSNPRPTTCGKKLGNFRSLCWCE